MEQKLKPLHLACSNNAENPSTALIGIRKNTATASNGQLLVKLDLSLTSKLNDIERKTLDGKYIHMDTWKEIFKCDDLEIEKEAIHCYVGNIKKTFYYETPNKQLWDNDTVHEIKDMGQDRKGIVCHSASQMEIIHKIFQEDHLNMSFSKKNRGTVIFPASESGMFAILKLEDQVEPNRYLFLD